MIVNDHQIAGGIADSSPPQAFETISGSTQRPHHADRERDLLLGIAFVGVEAAVHPHDRQATQQAAHQSGRRGRWPWIAGNGGLRRKGAEKAVSIWSAQAAQPGAQHDPGERLLVPLGPDDVRSLGNFGGE